LFPRAAPGQTRLPGIPRFRAAPTQPFAKAVEHPT